MQFCVQYLWQQPDSQCTHIQYYNRVDVVICGIHAQTKAVSEEYQNRNSRSTVVSAV